MITVSDPSGHPVDVVSGSVGASSEWLESRRKPGNSHRISNDNKENWGDLFRVQKSALAKVFVPSLILTVWSALVAVFYLVPQVSFLKTAGLPNSTTLVALLGTAMSLLLVFRVNTAYDRFWEGRKMWSTVHYQLRNLGRFIWVFCVPKTDDDVKRQKLAMNLLIAFAHATKHSLRDEPSHRYIDVGPYVQHLKGFGTTVFSTKDTLPIPLEITLQLQSFLNGYATILFPASTAVNALAESLSTFQRIRTSPIPAAYSIHLKQTLFIYLLSLPFQLVSSPLGWCTIPVVFFSSMIMLGIEVIGGEIENPFGYDLDDLPMDDYCDAIEQEILQIMASEDPTKDCQDWIQPFSLSVDRVDLRQVKLAAETAVDVGSGGRTDSPHLKLFGVMRDAMGKIVNVVEHVHIRQQ